MRLPLLRWSRRRARVEVRRTHAEALDRVAGTLRALQKRLDAVFDAAAQPQAAVVELPREAPVPPDELRPTG